MIVQEDQEMMINEKFKLLEEELKELRIEFNGYRWGAELLYELEEFSNNKDFDLKKFIDEKIDEIWKKTIPISDKITEKSIEHSELWAKKLDIERKKEK